MPFIFLALLAKAVRRMPSIMKQIYHLDQDKAVGHWESIADWNKKWSSMISHPVPLILILALCVTLAILNIAKPGILEGRGQLFWWHPDLSPGGILFVILSVSVFFNVMGISYLFMTLLATTALVTQVLRATRLRVDPNHSDRSGGLSVVGDLLSLIIPFVAVLSFHVSASLFEHIEQDRGQVIADFVALGVLFLLFFTFMLLPMSPVRRQMRLHVNGLVEKIGAKRREVESSLSERLALPGVPTEEQLRMISGLRSMARELRCDELSASRLRTWPIRRSSFAALVLLGASPVALSIAILAARI